MVLSKASNNDDCNDSLPTKDEVEAIIKRECNGICILTSGTHLHSKNFFILFQIWDFSPPNYKLCDFFSHKINFHPHATKQTPMYLTIYRSILPNKKLCVYWSIPKKFSTEYHTYVADIVSLHTYRIKQYPY